MMARTARVVVPGIPHHVTQRGHEGREVFSSNDDRQGYLVVLGDYSRRFGLRVWAYCLMSNHVHLIVVPEGGDSMSRTVQAANSLYVRVAREDHEVTGHIWQSRYYSCPLDPAHLWEAVRYVERNPVRAGLVRRAEEYVWSSAPAHCGLRADPVLSDDLPLLGSVGNWSAWLGPEEDEEALQALRYYTRQGRPYGLSVHFAAVRRPGERAAE
jgi:REP-associated tyrosine transposase